MIYTIICTPAKSGHPDGSLAQPFRMETATLEFINAGGRPNVVQAKITNRAGQELTLDMDAVRALGYLLQDLEREGRLDNPRPRTPPVSAMGPDETCDNSGDL